MPRRLVMLLGGALLAGVVLGAAGTWIVAQPSEKVSSLMAVSLSNQNVDLVLSNGTPAAAREALLEHVTLLQKHQATLPGTAYDLSMTRAQAMLGTLSAQLKLQQQSVEDFAAAGNHCRRAGLAKCSEPELRTWSERALRKVTDADSR